MGFVKGWALLLVFHGDWLQERFTAAPKHLFYSNPSINHSRAAEKPWQRSPARTHIPPTAAPTGEEEGSTDRETGEIHTTKSLQRKPAINCSKKGRGYFRPNALQFVLMMSCWTFCMSRFSQPMNKWYICSLRDIHQQIHDRSCTEEQNQIQEDGAVITVYT